MAEDQRNFKCNICGNIGVRQLCREHNMVHGHGMVHLKKEYKDGVFAWWLCSKCAEKEQ